MPIRARTIRTNTEAVRRDTALYRAELAKLEADPHVTPEGKHARSAPLWDKIRARLAMVRDANAGLLEAAAAEAQEARGDFQRRAAAAKDPARVVAVRELASTLEDGELIALARLAANPDAPDPAVAYALGAASGPRLNKMQPGARTELLDLVATTGASPKLAGVVSDWVAARVEYARFEALADPQPAVSALTRYREAVTIDTTGRGPRTLSDEQVAEHFARVGLPMDPRPVAAAA